jgi:hypothetical protein
MATSVDRDRRAESRVAPQETRVDIVVPVLDEAHVLVERITTLHHYLRDHFHHRRQRVDR